MSTSTLSLKLWSNYSPNKTSETGEPNKLMNVGTAWPIEPSGIIPEPDDTFPAPVVDGTIKVYRNLHPETLVIQWLFPNVHVGHVLWISQAPARLTFAQVDTVRHIERQLADDWADTIRCIPFTTPPPVAISLGPGKIYSVRKITRIQTWQRSAASPQGLVAQDHQSLC